MGNEFGKLTELYDSGKITKEELKALESALEKPKERSSLVKWLQNPFEWIAGPFAVVLGLGLAFAISSVAQPLGIHFPGVLDLKLPVQLGVSQIFLQNVVAGFVPAVVFFLSALKFGRKGQRFLDYWGTCSLARFPYLLATGVFYAASKWSSLAFDVHELEKTGNLSLMPTGMIIGTIATLIGLIWMLVLYFSALRVSSGLRGRSLWLVYFVGILISEICAITVSVQWILPRG